MLLGNNSTYKLYYAVIFIYSPLCKILNTPMGNTYKFIFLKGYMKCFQQLSTFTDIIIYNDSNARITLWKILHCLIFSEE